MTGPADAGDPGPAVSDRLLRACLRDALASIDLRGRVAEALAGRSGAPFRRVVAVGKAATAMVEGALDASPSIRAALVVLPDGAPPPRSDDRLLILRASHPLPDERSVIAGEACLAFRADLALISAGTSSLVFAPRPPMTLAEARATFASLLASGADVRAINEVRRRASLVHGGGLGPLPTIIASDVIGGAPRDIGSGPTVPDAGNDDARIVVEPGDLARALATRLGCARARVLDPSLADVATLAREYVALASTLAPGDAIVRSAEPSLAIALANPGAGGRCTHLAALVARDLPPGVTFLAAASDGVDGSSGTAGAIVDSTSFPDRPRLDAALEAYDTGPLHLEAGTALPAAPTGVNLTDVHALVRR